MNIKLQNALQNVEMTYSELVEVANDMTKAITQPVNELVEQINKSINGLSVDQIRDYILRLQLKAFEISETKEKSALKAELADALHKERFAISFNSLEGSAAAKEKLAIVEVSSELIAETLYNLVANLLKTKVDQLHRLVDCLKSILMSRMQEAKFMNIGTSSDAGVTFSPNGKTYLAE